MVWSLRLAQFVGDQLEPPIVQPSDTTRQRTAVALNGSLAQVTSRYIAPRRSDTINFAAVFESVFAGARGLASPDDLRL